MSLRNRLANVDNKFQQLDKFTRILCICSAGLLRSPTIARVLQKDYDNVNVRAAGVSDEYALVRVDEALVSWADIIICAEDWHADQLDSLFGDVVLERKVPLVALNIPDEFNFADPKLEEAIRERLADLVDTSGDVREFELLPLPTDDFPDPTDLEEEQYY